VSVIVSVYNEGDVIERKIENCLGMDYPKEKLEILIGSDGSTDGTNEILSKKMLLKKMGTVPNYCKPHVGDSPHFQHSPCFQHAGESSHFCSEGGLRIIVNDVRQGKPYTINRLVKEAKGEILFFTDARQEIERDALRKLVRNFEDENIGCVSGELVYSESATITGRGIGAYWRYEKYLREMESDIHSMIGATGAIYALRKKLFEPIPEDTILDDLYTPFVVVSKGYRAIFNREAKVYDMVGETPRDEHRRKIRTLSGNYQIFFKMPHMLNPFKSRLALQIISHKLLRVLIPFFMAAFFLSNITLLKTPCYSMIFIAQVIFYSIAFVEALFRRRIKRVFGIPYLFCLMNFSAFVSFWAFLFNRSNVKWEKART